MSLSKQIKLKTILPSKFYPVEPVPKGSYFAELINGIPKITASNESKLKTCEKLLLKQIMDVEVIVNNPFANQHDYIIDSEKKYLLNVQFFYSVDGDCDKFLRFLFDVLEKSGYIQNDKQINKVEAEKIKVDVGSEGIQFKLCEIIEVN
jgi:Holliday junction resolvase RusA-like endonuclease